MKFSFLHSNTDIENATISDYFIVAVNLVEYNCCMSFLFSIVWDPHTHGLQEELEKVQNRAARFVTGNYVFETGSITGILSHLKWESEGQ